MEELRRLTLESVADTLQRPSEDEEHCRELPCAGEDGSRKQGKQREQDERNPEGVAGAIHRMPVTAGILRDPLLAGAVSQHGPRL